MPYTTRDSVSLYYERDQNGGERETVVFVEGLGVGRWLWHWQREAFADEYDLLLPDNRGSGESDAPLPPVVPRLPQALRVLWFLKIGGYSIEAMAADLEAVLADAGVERAHVVGASMGGMIAQRYALEYDRAESLCLLCTTHGGEDAVPIPDETQTQIYDTPEDATEREKIRHRMGPALTDRFAEENPETIEQILDWREQQDADEVPREAQGAAGANFDVSDRVQGIDLPTLVLHGTDDRVLPVENGKLIAEKLPDAQLEILERPRTC
jgi:Predicted hydrolases or acyltransferases (alpha/beta hydrolase superfamily)